MDVSATDVAADTSIQRFFLSARHRALKAPQSQSIAENKDA